MSTSLSATLMISFIDEANSRITLIVGQAAQTGESNEAEMESRLESETIQFDSSPIVISVPSVEDLAVNQLVTLKLSY